MKDVTSFYKCNDQRGLSCNEPEKRSTDFHNTRTNKKRDTKHNTHTVQYAARIHGLDIRPNTSAPWNSHRYTVGCATHKTLRPCRTGYSKEGPLNNLEGKLSNHT